MAPRPIETIVLCFLIQNEKVLLLKRSPSKKVFPSRWDGIAGKIEPGETALQAAVREFKEETGLTLEQPALRGVFNMFDHQHGYERIIFLFRAVSFSGEMLEQSAEGDLSWINIRDVRALDVIPDIPYYVDAVVQPGDQVLFGHYEFDQQGDISTLQVQ